MRLPRWVPRINGARGGAMFFKGLIAIVFGLAFHSPWQIIPPPPKGLALLDTFLPLEMWAIGWYISGLLLILGAFRQNQAKAMGLYAAMLFVWFASYLTTTIMEVMDQGYSYLWFAVAIYGGLLGSAVCVARLINAPAPQKLDEVMTLEIEVQKEPGDDS